MSEYLKVLVLFALCGSRAASAVQRTTPPDAADLQAAIVAPSTGSGLPNQFTVTNTGSLGAPATLLKVAFKYVPCEEEGQWSRYPECDFYQGYCPKLPATFEAVVQALPPGGHESVLRSSLATMAVPSLTAYKPQTHDKTYVEWNKAYLVCVLQVEAVADAQSHVAESSEANNTSRLPATLRLPVPF